MNSTLFVLSCFLFGAASSAPLNKGKRSFVSALTHIQDGLLHEIAIKEDRVKRQDKPDSFVSDNSKPDSIATDIVPDSSESDSIELDRSEPESMESGLPLSSANSDKIRALTTKSARCERVFATCMESDSTESGGREFDSMDSDMIESSGSGYEDTEFDGRASGHIEESDAQGNVKAGKKEWNEL